MLILSGYEVRKLIEKALKRTNPGDQFTVAKVFGYSSQAGNSLDLTKPGIVFELDKENA